MKKISAQRISVCLLLFALAALFLCSGCVSQQPPGKNGADDKAYGTVQGAFRHRWWNYYERGQSFADGKLYREALDDFATALKKREADQRLARTYGMHFVDYFPHREMGVVHYFMGNLKAAEEELERSLSQYPSAKAGYYLDKVRKARLEAAGKAVSVPELVFEPDTPEIWTAEDHLVLAGTARDENFIAGLSINGEPWLQDGAQEKLSFSRKIPLKRGRQTIEVKAHNLLGGVISRTVVVHLDQEGPIVTLDEVKAENEAATITVSGSVYDEAGITSLLLNGRELRASGETELFFAEKFTALTAKDDLQLLTQDRLGNKTVARLESQPSKTAGSPLLLASSSPDPALMLAALAAAKNTTAPLIRLKDWSDTQTVYLDKIYLEGEALDQGKIVSLKINGEPMLRREGKNIFFSHLLDLKEGDNTIIIAATNAAGEENILTIRVARKIPQALQLAERLSVTVLPFASQSGDATMTGSFQNNLTDALLEQNRFRLVERDKLEVIMQEQKLSQTKLIDQRTALRVGRLVAARMVLTGSVAQNQSGIEIVARLIDTETSEILASEDVYGESLDLAALRSLSQGLAIKFHRDFPLLDGLVLQEKGEAVFTDLGADKIQLQRRLIFFREEPITHPLTGKVMGADHVIVGHGLVTQVMPELSKVKILAGAGKIKKMDRVITE